MNQVPAHCSVKAGVNTCEICQNEAYYSCYLPQKLSSQGLPCMELFRCGHGCCSECYKEIAARGFKCPWCRSGRTYIASFGESDLPVHCWMYNEEIQRRSIDTLTEFVNEWKNYLNILQKREKKHPFMILHSYIVEQERERRKRLCEAREEEMRQKRIQQVRQAKKADREAAVCPHCGKDTFTSTNQLAIHIYAKHPHVKKSYSKTAKN